MLSVLCGKLIQGHIILDVIGNTHAIFRGDGFEVASGKVGVGRQVGVMPALDDAAYGIAGGIRLEVGLDGRDGGGLFRLDIGDELRELLFQQFILGFEARDEAEDFLQDLAQGDTTIHGGGFAQLVEGVILIGLIENFTVHVVDHAVPLSGLDGGSDGIIRADDVFELLEEHAVDFHTVKANHLFLDHREDIRAEMLVSAAHDHRAFAFPFTTTLSFGRREFQHLVIVELLLEIFAVGKEVEKLEGRFCRVLYALLGAVVEELLPKIVFAGAASLDLNEIGGRKDRTEETEVEDVGAIVAGGHHADRDADTRLAGLVGGDEIARAEQVVVAEVDGELLSVGYLGGHLYREVRLVLAGEHTVRHLIENLRQLCGVVLADGKDDRLADFPADRVAQGVFQKRFAKELVGGIRKETFFELSLLEGLLLILAGVIGERDDEAFFGKQRGGNFGAGVHHRRIDQKAVLHPVEQGVAEGRLAVLAAKGAIRVEQQAALRLARVAGAWL